jgi:alpha-beta hydrolase superfamily lysophospholipase
MPPGLFDDPAATKNLFFPRPTFRPPGSGARDLAIAVAPGVELHARLHEAPAARAAMILFHGNGEVVSDYDDMASLFADAGAALAVVDYRGYGRSGGAPRLAHLFADAVPAFEAIASALGGRADALPIVVMGRSLGSACAAEICRLAPERLAGVIYESGFSDLGAFASRRGVLPSAITAAEAALLDPLPKLAGCHVPLLVLHGERDALIAPSEGRAAHAASGAVDKRLVLVPGRGHNDLSLHPLYWSEMGAFIARVAAPESRQAPP